MSSLLAKSIRAGISVQELYASANAPAIGPKPNAAAGRASGLLPGEPGFGEAARASGSPPNAVGKARRFYRRVGRRLLRLLRPLAAPLLYRLDFRIRSAVDRSESAATLRSIDAGLIALSSELAATRLDIASLMGAAKLTARSMSALKEGIEATHRQFLEVAGLRKIDRQAAERLIRHSKFLYRRNVIPLGHDVAVHTEEGYLLLPVEDPALLIAVVETGNRLEPGTHAVMLSLLRECDVLIDVGARIGGFTLPAARCVGPGGYILAVEPAPRLSSLLRRTVAVNHVSNWVEVQECAAGETNGTAPFGLSQRTGHNSLLPAEDTLQTIDVTVRQLDDLVAAGRCVNLVKIDVEGAELQVWRGMRRIVAESPGLAVILKCGPEHLQRGGVTADTWFGELTSSGHTAWKIDEATGTVSSLRPSGLKEVDTLNVLLIRDHPLSLGLRVI